MGHNLKSIKHRLLLYRYLNLLFMGMRLSLQQVFSYLLVIFFFFFFIEKDISFWRQIYTPDTQWSYQLKFYSSFYDFYKMYEKSLRV